MENRTETLNEIIRNRRSIYPVQYTDEKIDDSVITEILENARWAPTHKLTQPWSFMVFSGDGLKKLAEYQSELYKKVSISKGNFNEKSFQSLAEKPLKASHVIAIGMKRDEAERIPEVEEVASVACAVQNMYLSAYAYGLGAYWGSGGITYYNEAKAFFGLGDKDRLLGFLYLGKHKMERAPVSRRMDLNTKVKWIS